MKIMITLVKLHLMTILNKYNRRMLLILAFVMLGVITYMGVRRYTPLISDVQQMNSYLYDNTFFHKPLLLFFSCYLFGMGFQEKNDQLRGLIVRGKKTRLQYLMTKLIAYLVVYTLMWGILVTLFVVVGIVRFRSFGINNQLIDYIWSLYLYALSYGLISSLIVIIIPTDYNSFMAIMMALTIEMLSSTINQQTVSFKIITCFFAFLKPNDNLLIIVNGQWYNLILELLYVGVITIVYFQKDLY